MSFNCGVNFFLLTSLFFFKFFLLGDPGVAHLDRVSMEKVVANFARRTENSENASLNLPRQI